MKKMKLKALSTFVSLIATSLVFIGCSDDDLELPPAIAGFTFQVNQNTGIVAFTNTSQSADNFLWDFGDGNTSTLSNPTNTYSSGEFLVTLTASNVAGSTDTAQETITITSDGGTVTPVDFDSGLLTSGDFEGDNSVWTGGGLNIITEGGNSFQQVDVQAAGNPFDVNISQQVDIAQGTTYVLSFDASSTTEQSILAGIGLNIDPFTNNSQEVSLTSQLERYTLSLTANNFGGVDTRILFDLGAAIGLVTIDNVSLIIQEPTAVEPSDFDDGLLTSGDFEGDNSVWIGGGLNIISEGGNSFQQVDVQAAGNPFDVNISQLVDLVEGTTYELSFDASSSTSQTILAGIGLNVDPFTNANEPVVLTPELQRYTVTLAATGFGGADNRVLFDMGAAIGLVTIDNVSLTIQEPTAVEPSDFDSGLLTSGDFEGDNSVWFNGGLNIVTQGGNSFQQVDVQAAGNPFDVNISQLVDLVEGATYELSFDASSSTSQTILAGIGLNEQPFTAVSEPVALTTDLQRYTVMLTASGFGSTGNRVLFDMGAAIGIVTIDNVRLIAL